MKTPKIDFKQVKETLKTITLTALVAGIAGFAFGLQYEVSNHQAIDAALNHIKAVDATTQVPASK